MLIPATYNLPLVENSDNVYSFEVGGITTAVGYVADVDIRDDAKFDANLILGFLSPSSGITISSNGIVLAVTLTITLLQSQMLATIIRGQNLYWSLQIVDPSGISSQYLNGSVVLTGTPTP